MTHLGERASNLVDGQLSPEAAERAHAHLAGCRRCRDLVEAERLTKARLGALFDEVPDDAFVGRLLVMGGPAGPLPPREGHVPGSPRPKPVSVGGTRAPGSSSSSGRRPGGSARPGGVPQPPRPSRFARRGRVRLAAAMITAMGAVGAGVTILAAASPVAPASVVPAVDSFVVRHAVTTTRLPVLDISSGWQVARKGSASTSRRGGASGR